QQIELLCRVVQVGEDLGLRGESLAPGPFLEELRRERIAVGIAFRVESGAGVAIPVPNAADSARALVRPHAKPELAESMERAKPCDACADDDCVEVLRAHARGEGILPDRPAVGSTSILMLSRASTEAQSRRPRP